MARQPNPNATLRAAIIGLGDVAHVHLDAIRSLDGIELVGVCDTDPSRAEVAAEVPFFTDLAEMVERTTPDCVHVCLPHDLHLPITEQLAALGCNVLCEKPVARNTAEAQRFAELEAARPDLLLALCLQNRRNATTLRLLAEIMDRGLEVEGIRGTVAWYRAAEYFSTKPWRGSLERAGGGVLINQAIHTLDLMTHVGAGAGPVVSVHGSIAGLCGYPIDVEDTATARLEFANGATGLFVATNANFTNESVQLSVSTSGGTYVIRDGALFTRDGEQETLLAEDLRLPGIKYYYGAGHQILIREVYDAIASGSDQYVHIRDGLTSIRVIDAIRESHRAGTAVPLTHIQRPDGRSE